ncbi:MAG: ATP synthase F1 subunit gamma [Clostridia bacterium]
MSSIAEIRHHIKSIDDTAKITRAMHLIASSKMKKAMRAHDQTMLYYNNVRSNMRFILDNSPEGLRSSFYRDSGDKAAYLIIAGDKGMCGGYNHDVLKLAYQELQNARQKAVRIVTFGHVATNFMQRRDVHLHDTYLTAVQNPSLDIAREIGAKLCLRYRQMAFDEVYVIFTQLLKGGITKPTKIRLLPITRDAVADVEPMHAPIGGLDFLPGRAEVLDAMAQHYVSGMLYSALVQSFASENRARMTAMESATRNADDMHHKLVLTLNHARQAAITQEINEIIGGNPDSFVL